MKKATVSKMKLTDREWKEFYIGQLFEVKRPSARSEKEYDSGEYPFVASGNFNNGVIRCCSQKEGERVDNGNCITVSPVDGSAFYQISDFLGRGGAGSSVLLLYNEKINRYSGLYISKALRQTCSKYSYGKMGNQDGIKRERIMLPIDDLDNPDYTFMEEYVREEEKRKKEKYIAYAKKQLDKLKYIEVPALDEKEWGEFSIGGDNGIFTITSGKRLTKTDMDNGNIPFIGATDSNNGITNWVGTPNSTLDSNVLGVNYNGSVVENFYHPYLCVFSDDVKRLHLKNHKDNKYILLFFKSIILNQKNKYTYGYKFNAHRMERQKILLPIDEHGTPAYEYMEQYAKNLIIVKLKKYLAFAKKK